MAEEGETNSSILEMTVFDLRISKDFDFLIIIPNTILF